MARDIQDYNGQVTVPDTFYPNGRIKDDTGSNDGTDIDEQACGDQHQFFAKLMREAGVVYNSLPDNEYNGNQFFQAARKLFKTFFDTTIYNGIVTPLTPGGGSDLLIVIVPGAVAGNTIELPESTDPSTMDNVTIRVVNDSSNSISIAQNSAGVDLVNYSSSPYTLAGNKIAQFTLFQNTGNWVVTDK